MTQASAARAFEPYVIDGPRAELSGPETMYVPTNQIRIRPDGDWHRRSAVPCETACGEEYAACYVREYELAGPLCPTCFTPRELELAAKNGDSPR